MKLTTFTVNSRSQAGVVLDEEIVPINDPLTGTPVSMRLLLQAGPEGIRLAERAPALSSIRFALKDVRLEAPVPEPRKFLGLGGNFRSHVEEINRMMPSFKHPPNQVWFNKQVTCVTGPFSPIFKPSFSETLDYEGELGLVIGQRCRNVRASDAHKVIAGFMVCNDVSIREWQQRSMTQTLGK